MQIHVVRPGESLYSIARLYNTNYNLIVQANQIPNPNVLVVGQALVIPIVGSYHWVQPGESLYSISRRYNIPASEIIRVNQIQNPNLIYPGLRLYIPPAPRPTIDVGAYIDLKMNIGDPAEVVNEVGENLTYLSIFSYAIKRDGTVSPINDQPTINAAYRDRVVPLMVITNFEEGTFSTELATVVLSSDELQEKILNSVIAMMKEKGYRGLDFDFEYLGAENRERYLNFLRKASLKLKQEGFIISAALAPKLTGDQVGTLYEGHDYRGVGAIVDFIFFMTYEWGWSGGPPMAVAPIDQVRKVMNYAISVVPKNKIMMGIPLYGYDWTLPYVRGGKFARSISPQQAIQIAAEHNVAIQYDYVAQAPFFNYTDNDGKRHVVWFEDARSVQAKFNLVKQLGIRGLYYWVLGFDFPQNWLLLRDNFIVRKRVV